MAVSEPAQSLAKSRSRTLAVVLRVLGIIDLLAVVVVVLPTDVVAAAHRFIGLGEFPGEPIVEYLARASSLLYALHGSLLVFMSFDVRRYARLIRFLGGVTAVCGIVLIGVDVVCGMPLWWILAEGPIVGIMGAAIWMLARDVGDASSEAAGE